MDYNFLTIGFRALYQRTKKVRRGLESEMSLFRSIISKFSYIFFQKPFFLSHHMLYKPISPTNIPITLEVFDSAPPAVKKRFHVVCSIRISLFSSLMGVIPDSSPGTKVISTKYL